MVKIFNQDAANLLSLILEVDPKKRITTEQILNHSWLRNGLKSKSNKLLI
jgi:serine/threonine protein kinase